MCTQHIPALGQRLLDFSMAAYRGISDLALMRIDVSSALILFYLALTQSLLIKEQGGKWQKAALPVERNSILLEGYKTDFQGSNGVT